MSEFWSPRCERPVGLVRPVRRDPTGRAGPTKRQTRGRRWRRTSRGWYVPADSPVVVEQRILEQSVRLPEAAALTAWAALRWRGANYFEGVDRRTGEQLPVPVVLGGWSDVGRDERIHVSRERFWPHQIENVDDVPCAIPERALFDEVRRRPFRSAVAAADMTFAAGISSADQFSAFVLGRTGWTGVPYARTLLPWIRDDSRSPQETWMRLVWELDANLPRPMCNQPVFDRSDHLLGVPDLFDPVAGVVGEYDGGHHDADEQRRSDRDREERFRDHGLEYFDLARGDRARPGAVVRRMQAVRQRARFLPPERRPWTLEPPRWWLDREAG